MLRREVIRGVGGLGGLAGIGGLALLATAPATVQARPVPPTEPEPAARAPISIDNPRVWPAVTRHGPLPMGAVDAFRAPARAKCARAQLVDEGVANRVYLEQPALERRVMVLWNTSLYDRVIDLVALGDTAQALDKFGRTRGLGVAADGHISITLPRATANTIPGYPETYFIGGEPLLVVESLPNGYAPYAPTFANLPLPTQR